jgi:hypothetical protein
MFEFGKRFSTFILIVALALGLAALPRAYAQVGAADEAIEGEPIEPAVLDDEEAADEEALEEEAPIDEAFVERAEELEPGEAENRWTVKINAAIRANYVFNDSPDSFVIKYRWEIVGQANAATAVIRGDAEISAEVEGFLAKWPTGECSLSVTIPKVPFELTFRKSDEERGSVALKFRRNIMENWQSKCTFTDAPGARFETTGDPERWLAKAVEKARPPLRSIVTDLGDEETTTSFVINKEVIDDPPLGTVEIEGTGVVTITPGTGE